MAPDDAFSQVMQKVNELGYTVVDADRDAGFIRAELHVNKIFDPVDKEQLTISVYEIGETGEVSVRVTASSLDEDGDVMALSGRVQEHAQEIVRMFPEPVEHGT